LQLVGLTDQAQEGSGFALAGGDLVHDSTGRADDAVLDLLAHLRDFHCADAPAEVEVIQQVHHRGDFDRRR
jgi:hypothetical protein